MRSASVGESNATSVPRTAGTVSARTDVDHGRSSTQRSGSISATLCQCLSAYPADSPPTPLNGCSVDWYQHTFRNDGAGAAAYTIRQLVVVRLPVTQILSPAQSQ